MADYFTLKVLLLELPHAIVIRLYGLDVCYVVAHTANGAFREPVISNWPGRYELPSCVKPRMPSPRHRGLTTMRIVSFASLVGKLNRTTSTNCTPS